MKRTDGRRLGVAPTLVVVAALAGCTGANRESTETKENPIKPDFSGGPAQGAVRAGAQRLVNQDLMRSVGTYYNLYRSENGRAPRNDQEFLAYVKSDPNARNVAQSIEKGWIIMVFPMNPSSNAIIGYEKEELQIQHNLLVVSAGGDVQRMTKAQLEQALMGQ